MLTALQYDCTVIHQEVEQCNSMWQDRGPLGHVYGSGEEDAALGVGEVPPPPVEKCLTWYSLVVEEYHNISINHFDEEEVRWGRGREATRCGTLNLFPSLAVQDTVSSSSSLRLYLDNFSSSSSLLLCFVSAVSAAVSLIATQHTPSFSPSFLPSFLPLIGE
jgi:hypothetical protein